MIRISRLAHKNFYLGGHTAVVSDELFYVHLIVHTTIHTSKDATATATATHHFILHNSSLEKSNFLIKESCLI